MAMLTEEQKKQRKFVPFQYGRQDATGEQPLQELRKGLSNIAERGVLGNKMAAAQLQTQPAAAQETQQPTTDSQTAAKPSNQTFLPPAQPPAQPTTSITGTAPADRAAMAALYPEGRLVSDQSGGQIRPDIINAVEKTAPSATENNFNPAMPSRPSPTMAQIQGTGVMQNSQTGEYVAIGANGQVKRFNAQGQPVSSMQKIDATMRPSQPQSGFSVQFDDTVDAATQRQVLNSLNNPNAFRGYRQGRLDTVDNAQQIASANTNRIINPERFQPAGAQQPMGWKTRRDLMLQQGQERMRESDNANERLMAREGLAAQNMRDRETRAFEERKFTAQSPLTAAQIADAQASTSMKNLQVDEAKRVNDFRQKYDAAEGADKEKLYQYGIRAGYLKQPDEEKAQIVKVPIRGEDGTVLGDDLYLAQGGKVTKVTGNEESPKPYPRDPKERKQGVKYTTPDGRIVTWDGKGALLAQ